MWYEILEDLSAFGRLPNCYSVLKLAHVCTCVTSLQHTIQKICPAFSYGTYKTTVAPEKT